MARYNVLDRCVIAATPDAVYGSMVRWSHGTESWWLPHLAIEPANDIPPATNGYQYWLRVGVLQRPRMLGEIVDVRPGLGMSANLIDGDFVGHIEWHLASVDSGTEFSFRWIADPNSWFGKLAAYTAPVAGMHSRVIQKGFQGLSRDLGTTMTTGDT